MKMGEQTTPKLEKQMQEDSKSIEAGSVNEGAALVTNDKSKLDVAGEFLALHEQEYGSYTKKEDTRVRWKIDLRLVPMLFLTQTLLAVDKILISNAALYGMIQDTHLKGQQYSWAGSIFFFGYLISEFPSNAIIQKFPVGKVMAISTIGWGSATVLMASCYNAAGLMALRFIMGALEAPIVPGCAIVTVMWYKKEEQPLRVAMWYSGFSSLFSGLIAYGVGQTHTAIAPWRLLFIVLGGFTVIWGVFLVLFLPDSPLKARFLNERGKYIAMHRIKGNKTGVENKTLKWYQVREAFTDLRTWPLVTYAVCANFSNGGFGVFSAQVVSSFGYGHLETVLLGIPTGMFMTFSALCVAIPNLWLKNMRVKISAFSALVPLAATILTKKLPEENKIGRLLSYYFIYLYWAAYPTVVSLSMANTSGHSKKVTMNAIMFLSYCLGNILAPQFFITAEAPGYKTGYSAIIAGSAIAVASLIAYEIIVRFDNRRKERQMSGDITPEMISAAEDQLDLTDKEKRGFRYIY